MKKVKLIKKKFAVIILDLDSKAFVIYITALNIYFNYGIKVHLSKKAFIAYLKVVKVIIKVSSKYIDLMS